MNEFYNFLQFDYKWLKYKLSIDTVFFSFSVTQFTTDK